MTHTYYWVTANHVSPTHQIRGQVAKVSKKESTGTYYSDMQGFGCSRDYKSPKDSIVGMLQSHACTDIRVKELMNQSKAENLFRNTPHVQHWAYDSVLELGEHL